MCEPEQDEKNRAHYFYRVICWSKFYKVKTNFWRAGRGPSSGIDRYHRLYIFLVSRWLGLIASLELPTEFVNTSDIVKFYWLTSVVFYLSLLERVFHVKILCFPLCFFFQSSLFAYLFDNISSPSYALLSNIIMLCFASKCHYQTYEATCVYLGL
jgi:hypothetical protein